jgi:hypothetical protein
VAPGKKCCPPQRPHEPGAHRDEALGHKNGTYGSSACGLFSSFSFPPSVLLDFVGEFESRRFGLGPLSGGLPSLLGGVGSRLDRFLGRHDEYAKIRV